MEFLKHRRAFMRLSQRTARMTFVQVKRAVIFIVGISIVIVGIAMMILPGPAFLVIPAGLAILATEFLWARRLLKRLRREMVNAGQAIQNRWSGTPGKDTPQDPPSDPNNPS